MKTKAQEDHEERVQSILAMAVAIQENPGEIACPFKFIGDKLGAVALITEIVAHTVPGRIAVVMRDYNYRPRNPRLIADEELNKKFDESQGLVEVRRSDAEIYILKMSWNSTEQIMTTHFGYAPRGVSVIRDPNGPNFSRIDIANDIGAEQILAWSRQALVKITNNLRYKFM